MNGTFLINYFIKCVSVHKTFANNGDDGPTVIGCASIIREYFRIILLASNFMYHLCVEFLALKCKKKTLQRINPE